MGARGVFSFLKTESRVSRWKDQKGGNTIPKRRQCMCKNQMAKEKVNRESRNKVKKEGRKEGKREGRHSYKGTPYKEYEKSLWFRTWQWVRVGGWVGPWQSENTATMAPTPAPQRGDLGWPHGTFRGGLQKDDLQALAPIHLRSRKELRLKNFTPWERQIPYAITYMWNLKYDTNEPETDSQT